MTRGSRFGSIYRKRRRDGSQYAGWFVRFVEGGRRVERSGFASHEAAETYLAARQRERSEMRALGIPELRRVPTRDAVEDYRKWLKAHRRPNTARVSSATLDVLVELRGGRDLVSLTNDDVAAVLDHLRRERDYAPGSMAHALAVLCGLWRWAVGERTARPLDARALRRRLPRVDVEEPPYLSPAELATIYAAVPPQIRCIVTLWGEAGLRMLEAVDLTWGELRPDCSAVTVSGARAKGHRPRTVHLSDIARAALEAELGERARALRGATPIWPDIGRHRAGDLFRAAMEKLGRRDVTPRTLRHAFGSAAAMAGVDLEIIRRLMGHRSITTTMIYACHRPKSAERDAIEQMQRHRAPPASQARNAT